MFSTNSTIHPTTYERMRDFSMWLTNEAIQELACPCALPPMLFVDDGRGVAISDLSHFDISTPEAVLSTLTRVLSEVARCLGGRGAAVVMPGWDINLAEPCDPTDDRSWTSPIKHPTCTECVLLTAVDHDHAESFLATLYQSAEDTLQLGEWFPVPNSGLTELLRRVVCPQG